MLNAALALVPLLSAYLLCTQWRLIRYRYARLDNQRFYLTLTVYAVCLGCIGMLLSVALLRFDWYSGLFHLTQENMSGLVEGPEQNYYLLAFFGLPITFLLGPFLANSINFLEWLMREFRRYPKGFYATLAAVSKDDFDLILFRAWASTTPACFTLTSGKVYVGYILRAVDPDEEEKSLRILPLLSGFRNTKHEIEFTTDYHRFVHEKDALDSDRESPHLNYSDFEIAIVRSAILTANLFDLTAFAKFQQAAATSDATVTQAQ